MKNIESLIERTGGCGPFQYLHVICTHMCRIIAIWGLNMMTFGNFDPGWTCLSPDLAPTVDSQNITWLKIPNNFSETPTNCSSITECSNIKFNPYGKTIVTQWNLMCQNDWIPSLIISLQMVGQLIGSMASGHIADNMGRKICMYSFTFLFAVVNLVAAFSTSWQMFAICRVFIGIGIGGIVSSAFVYTMEFLNPKYRGIVGGLPINNSGLAVFSLVVYLEKDWRLVQLTTAVIAFVATLTFFWISESMRWLTIHGQKDKAKSIVVKIARYNKTPVPNMDIIDQMSTPGISKESTKKYSYLDLFRYSKIRYITIKLALLWFFEVTTYFSLSFSVKALPGDFYLNFFIFSVSEIPSVLLTALIVNCIGRVKGGASYFFLAAIACASAAAISLSDLSSEYGIVIVLLAMTAKGSLAGGRSIVRICTSELTPTNIRTLGYSFHMSFSRIAAIISPYFIPGSYISLSQTLILHAAILLISSGIFLSLPESKDRAMDDVIDEGVQRTTSKDNIKNRQYEQNRVGKKIEAKDNIASPTSERKYTESDRILPSYSKY